MLAGTFMQYFEFMITALLFFRYRKATLLWINNTDGKF